MSQEGSDGKNSVQKNQKNAGTPPPLPKKNKENSVKSQLFVSRARLYSNILLNALSVNPEI